MMDCRVKPGNDEQGRWFIRLYRDEATNCQTVRRRNISVIASGAKQSSDLSAETVWIASAFAR
jgi:hypothetical protein